MLLEVKLCCETFYELVSPLLRNLGNQFLDLEYCCWLVRGSLFIELGVQGFGERVEVRPWHFYDK